MKFDNTQSVNYSIVINKCTIVDEFADGNFAKNHPEYKGYLNVEDTTKNNSITIDGNKFTF